MLKTELQAEAQRLGKTSRHPWDAMEQDCSRARTEEKKQRDAEQDAHDKANRVAGKAHGKGIPTATGAAGPKLSGLAAVKAQLEQDRKQKAAQPARAAKDVEHAKDGPWVKFVEGVFFSTRGEAKGDGVSRQDFPAHNKEAGALVQKLLLAVVKKFIAKHLKEHDMLEPFAKVCAEVTAINVRFLLPCSLVITLFSVIRTPH